MEREITYSVILPVYNGEKTLGRCLDSLTGQLREDIEILLINDGSRDGTEDLCRVYAGQYPQLRLFTKENGGVASARNFGLSQARGKYILFVDSDDWVSQGLFSLADRYLETKPDFVQLSYEAVTGNCRRPRLCEDRQLVRREQVLTAMAAALKERSINSPWAKIFKRERIEKLGIRFPEDLEIGEDKTFVLSYVLQANSAVTGSEVVYYASLDNENSLSRRLRPDLPEQLLLLHRELSTAVEQADLPKKHHRAFRKVLSGAFYRNIYLVDRELRKHCPEAKDRCRVLKAVCQEYNREQVKPSGLLCRSMALPQKLAWAGLIDSAVGLALKTKNRGSKR